MKEYSAATVAWYIALYLLSAAEENQGTELNDSLQCYNDFKSYVECTWKENRLSRQFVNMSLYKWVNGDIQLINGSQHKKTKSHIIWKSFMPTRFFSIGSVEKYFFAPNQNMESQVLLKIKNKDTIQKEMLKPIMYVSDDKYYFRWPDDLYKLTPHGEAYCEVKYKKETESWEYSTLGLCKSSWGIISGGLLLRGTKYVARMRVKPWFNDQNWSNWSSEVILAPRKKVKLSDEAKPQNLRCSNFTCTWEIRLEVKSSVSFSLFYKQNQTDQELEYSPSCLEEVVNIPYVSCHCRIPPTELHLQESSIVTVRPKQGNIIIQSCFYIKFAPRNLTLQVRDQGEEYLATWNTETLHSATFRYELCYGEGNAPLIEESSDGEKCLQTKLSELFLLMNRDIKPATMYYMRVRMRIDEPNPEYCYNGPWSEWSNFSTWETKTVLDLHLLYVMVPICFILLISSTLYGCKILKRTKEQWKARIPDPSKSIFIKDFLQKGSHLKCQYEENYHYEELFDVCKTMTSYKDFKDFTTNEINKEDVDSENMEQIDYDDSFGIFQNDDIDSTNLNVVISGYKPFSELIDDQKTVKQKDNQLLQNAYDGPYIFCSDNC